MIARRSNRFGRSLPGEVLEGRQPRGRRLVEDGFGLGPRHGDVLGRQAETLPGQRGGVPELQLPERRLADLVECSGQPAVFDGGVHGRIHTARGMVCQYESDQSLSESDHSLSDSLAEIPDLNDSSNSLLNSVYRVTFQTPV